jgi:ABC-type nitrate/sulfonate/bicarbonate transport system substrate-binding protein
MTHARADTATAAREAPARLRVNVFPSAKNLPFYVGLRAGVFARHGIELALEFTRDSSAQRARLAAGAFEIAHAAVDNAVAMVEVAGEDVVVVMGGDSGMNELIVRPEIGSPAELRGRTLIVDAPDTAYALLAKKLLWRHGLAPGRDYAVEPVGRSELRYRAMLEPGRYAASVLNPPYSILAVKSGLKSLGALVELLGPYQATGAFVMRRWARSNGELLERYIRAYVESLRLALDPARAHESVAALVEDLELDPAVARETYARLADPVAGLVPDARLDLQGFRNALALRAELAGSGEAPASPEKYLDLSYYERALRS